MKKLLLLSIASLTAIAGWSQSKINPAGLQELWQYKVDAGLIEVPGMQQVTKSVTIEPTVSAVVIIPENASAASLLGNLDVEILSEMNGVVVVSCPITETEKIAEISQVQQVGFGDKLKAYMDYGRPSGNVSTVQTGFSLNNTTYSFDGTGVVCGMMDTGLEANHLNFKNDDGTSRIQRLWHFTSSNGTSNMYTAATVSSFSTDDTDGTHATHVAGIMGGSYKGVGTYSQVTSPQYPVSSINFVNDGGSMPFYGVATGSDLALSVGELYGQNIVQGVTNIIDYAKQVGMPAVVNLSLGSNTGPHDGTDYIPEALGRLGTSAIICVSAGNEGAENMYVYKKLGSVAQDRYLRSVLASQTISSGKIDIWTGSNTVVPVQLGYVASDRQFHELISVTEAGKTYSSGSSDEFKSLFNGSATLTSSVNAANNRFNVLISLSGISQKDENSYMAISIGGDGYNGQTIYVYGTDVEFTNRTSATAATMAGYSTGSPAGSINDDACGENIVSVGAYVARAAYGVLSSSSSYSYFPSVEVGDIASFSSYGQNYQGDKLPIVAAPGYSVISSISRFYIENGNASANNMSGKATNGTATDYWGQMSGTSMSCPFTAGTIAMWLQAVPSLTIDQVKDVIANTSTYDALTMGTQRWGAGKLDALEGVKYVLQNYAANGAVWEDDEQRLVVTPNGAGYDVTMAGEASFTVTVYDMQGRPLTTVRGIDGQASVGTTELSAGIYVLAAQGASSRLTRKITVR